MRGTCLCRSGADAELGRVDGCRRWCVQLRGVGTAVPPWGDRGIWRGTGASGVSGAGGFRGRVEGVSTPGEKRRHVCIKMGTTVPPSRGPRSLPRGIQWYLPVSAQPLSPLPTRCSVTTGAAATVSSTRLFLTGSAFADSSRDGLPCSDRWRLAAASGIPTPPSGRRGVKAG